MSETEELPEIPDPTANHLFKVPRETLLPFFEQVPRLFADAQTKVQGAYQECLYATEHDYTPETIDRITAAFKLEAPQWGTVDGQDVVNRLDAANYPDTVVIAMIEAVPGMSLQSVSHYLHFFHHTYPLFTKATLKGLAKLDIHIPWTLVRDPEIYGLYIAALDELKERIPFWCVPESNVHLSRIIQAALEGYGA